MLYDIIFVLMLCVFTYSGYKRGLIRTLLALLAFLLAAITAAALAKGLSGVVYDSIVRPAVVKALEDKLQSLTSSEGYEYAQKVVAAIPVIFLGVLEHFDYPAPRLTSYLEKNSDASAVEMVGDLLRGPATGIIAILLFFVFFIVFLVIFLILARKIGKKLRLPVLSLVDPLGGATLGLVEGVLVVFLISTLMWLSIPFLPADVEILSAEYILSSKIIYFVFSKELGFLLQQFMYGLGKIKELGI